ncbi:MAG: flagellar basal-body MS-ring/collar protein FliF [Gemmobacter sp.]
MQRLTPFWSGLDPLRRAVVVGATVAVFVAVLALARFSTAPSLALFYSGLDPAAAGEVVAALDRRGVAYEVRGDAIWVDAAARDSLRMGLAAEGLPAVGGAGYELLDRLTGFGTTAQMFDAAYLRAKEGELARTIAASPAIRSARVHIAVPQGQPFRRDAGASASVTVTSRAGALTEDQARALRHLVAAAVAGLRPADVAVIDAVSGLVAGSDDPGSPARRGEDRAAALRASVERLLTARVGPGRALVEVAVDVVSARESISERRLDPQGRVAISTETEEQTESAQGTAPGVTVASNLPEGDGAGGETRSNAAQTRERVNFEVSEVTRAIERPPGDTQRLSVAVLVDGRRDADGVWAARSDAELSDLRDLVAAAVGFDEARGDVITIRSMEFEPVEPRGTLSEASIFAGLDPMRLIQLGVAAAVIVILGLFVLRPILAGNRRMPQPERPALALPGQAEAIPVLTGEIDEPGSDLRRNAIAAEADDQPPSDPVDRLRKLIAERQTESVEILRSWMEEREERRG